MKIVTIFFLLFSLSIYERVEANNCISVKIISKFKRSNENIKVFGVQNSEINKKDFEYDLKMNSNNVYKKVNSFKSLKEQEAKNEYGDVNLTFKDRSSREIQSIIDGIKKSLVTKKYNIVDTEADVLIILSSDYLYYDSISGDSFNKIQYSIENKGEEMYSGVFSQDVDCKGFSGFSKCKSKKIADKLSKRILDNLEQLCHK